MKKLFFFFCLLIFSGCSIFQPDDEPTALQPKLLKQSSLPAIRESIYSDKFEFYCEMLVNEKGDVEQAWLLTHSGDEVWDSLATLSLLDWKFEPASMNGVPIKTLIRRRIQVKFEQPEIMYLAEILMKSHEQADSVYNALLNGADFNELVLKYSVSPTRMQNGLVGNVEIKHYSKNISDALSGLSEGEFTKPLQYGECCVIFRRLRQNN